MRRSDREITDQKALLAILDSCEVMRVGLVDGDRPYVVPMNYGYRWEGGQLTLYFHSAKEGMKLNLIRKNAKVCFEVDCGHALIPGENACQYGYAFQSVVGFGKAEVLEDPQEKITALRALMQHMAGEQFAFTEQMVSGITVWQIQVSEFTGKKHMAE